MPFQKRKPDATMPSSPLPFFRLKDLDLPIPLSVWLVMIVVAALRIWMVSSQRLTALGGAVYDDRLFLNLAASLLKGNWLGEYNNLTLAKGPFYPFWIAAMSKMSVPLLFSEHLFYTAACIVFVIACKPLLHSPLIVCLTFTALLFNPMSYSQPMMTQVLRDGIYPSLVMLVVSCAVGLLVRANGRADTLAFWATGLGLALSAFLLTREEGIWIAPSLIIVVGAAASRMRRNLSVLKISAVMVLPVLLCVAIVVGTAAMNKVRYGLFAVNELKSADFTAAYGALLRVKHDGGKPAVPVPLEVRNSVYEASPAFSELSPFLEGNVGKRWIGVIKPIRRLYEEDLEFAAKVRTLLDMDPTGIWKKVLFADNRDLMGGWFVWAFRDAAAAAGYYSSSSTAAAYYRRLANEVNAACSDGKLSCLGERPSVMQLMPPWRNEYTPLFIRTLASGAFSLAGFEGFNPFPDPSIGDEESFKIFRDVTHEVLFPSELRVKGWAFSADSVLGISIVNAKDVPVRDSVPNLPSPDVYEYFLSKGEDASNARNARFDIRIGPFSGASYLCLAAGRQIKKIPFDGSITNYDGEGLHLKLDYWGYRGGTSKEGRARLSVLELVGRFYQWTMPPLLVISLIGYLAGIISALRKPGERTVMIVATSLIFAIFARLAMLSVIHVTSFPAILPQYLASSYPLLISLPALVLPGLSSKLYGFTLRLIR